MKVIGITGGIGSGKSLVTSILKEKYGARILNTDQIARDQMEAGGASYPGVVDYFGKEILSEDGTINRSKLAAIVFEDRDKLLKLNELTHPIVLVEVIREIEFWQRQGNVPYLVIETALMIESGYDFVCDEVWYVYAPEQERRNRLKRERNYSDEKIDSIFESQSKPEAFTEKFPKMVENIGAIAMLEQQVVKLLEQ